MRNYNRIDFFKIIATKMANSLDFIKINPKNVLIFGCDYSQSYNLLKKIYKNANFTELDIRKDLLKLSRNYIDNKLKELFFSKRKQIFFDQINKINLSNQYDILWSNLFIVYKFNDIGNIFSKWMQLLKKNGMFFFTLFGSDTLKEVITVLKSYGISCNIKCLFDIQELGDKLLNYNFKDPVLYSEKILFNYKKYFSFIQDMRIIYLLDNLEFKNEIEYAKANDVLQNLFLQDQLQDITFEILYIHALKNFDYTNKVFPINNKIL